MRNTTPLPRYAAVSPTVMTSMEIVDTAAYINSLLEDVSQVPFGLGSALPGLSLSLLLTSAPPPRCPPLRPPGLYS